VTLATLGDQTITVTDTRASGFTSTTTINVNTTPDMAITKSHTGNFTIGQTGAVYTITVSNLGRGPSSGTVTVTDSLPAGLTATAISGTGWSCTLGTLTCTRGDALGVGGVYPPITLTVNVATNTPASVVNSATVSGGGETNTNNNVANDPTTVTAPDLAVFTSHTGPINTNIFFQGEPGFYTIAVQNAGTLQTSGTVTFTDSLPAGLNATDISGTGWSCTLATLTCTRSDALGPNSSYPVITLTVDVPLNAPSNVTNVATVSGGGEVNTANDTFQDFTTISPPRTPDLAITKFHNGSFIQGQTGVYFINVSNVGTAATSGAITVTDTLPTGLTATDISGTGWSCVLATLTCSRSDALNFNTSYPQIALTVNVAANAPATVINTVTVSGGGDTNAVNNNASDFTTIVPSVVDLRLTLFAAGSLSVGDTNQLQVFGVVNAGNTPSSGTVTVTASVTAGITVASIGGTGWNCTLSTLTCTRSDSVAPNFNDFPEIDVRVNVALNAPSRVTTTLTVSGGGDSVPGNNTFPFDTNVFGPVTINIFPASASVNAGQTATIPLSVGLAQAAGSVTFSCSGLPTASSCSFNPPSATLTSSSLVTLSITTTARSASVPGLRMPGPGSPMWWMLGLSLAALIAVAFRSRGGPARSFKPAFAGGMALVLVLAAVGGCGGGGGPPPPPPVIGTPAGTYAISVTGTTPIGANSTTLTLTVR
jgi:uncharacterized repeat protein (TIGR01451 family)